MTARFTAATAATTSGNSRFNLETLEERRLLSAAAHHAGDAPAPQLTTSLDNGVLTIYGNSGHDRFNLQAYDYTEGEPVLSILDGSPTQMGDNQFGSIVSLRGVSSIRIVGNGGVDTVWLHGQHVDAQVTFVEPGGHRTAIRADQHYVFGDAAPDAQARWFGSAQVINGILDLRGSAFADEITVRPTRGNGLAVMMNGEVTLYSLDGVRGVMIRGGAGDDDIEMYDDLRGGGVMLPVTLSGGTGNDYLMAQDGRDSMDNVCVTPDQAALVSYTLLGGDGDDWLCGGIGHGAIDGGAGNDQIYAPAGAAVVTGTALDAFDRSSEPAPVPPSEEGDQPQSPGTTPSGAMPTLPCLAPSIFAKAGSPANGQGLFGDDATSSWEA